MSGYLQWKKSYLTPGAYINYERWNLRFRKFLKKNPSEIRLEDVWKFKQYLTDRGYSPKNIQFGLTLTKDYIGYLATVESLDFPISLFKIKVERANSHYAITKEEYDKILLQLTEGDIQTVQRRLMIQILWETGMRVGELLNLKYTFLSGGETIIHNEKNTRSRMIAWSQETEHLLQGYIKVRKKVKSVDDSLFVGFGFKKKAKKMTSRHVQRIIYELRIVAKLPNKISPHSFRHGFVHRQLDKGRPITTVAQMLGHSTTMNVMTYHQLSGLEVRKAWERI